MKQETKDFYQTIISNQKTEHQQEMKEAVDIIGSLYDELLQALEKAGGSYAKARHEEISKLQTRFYNLATKNNLSLLTPRQKQIIKENEA